jgi:hypothetical protein
MDALAIILATQATREFAWSALPNAPVEPPDEPRRPRNHPIRKATAAALYRVAELVEPRVGPAVQH